MVTNQPETRQRPISENIEVVEVKPLELTNYQVLIDSYGNIQSSTSGSLVAQVSGLIVNVADNFKSGKAFSKGQVLIEIDSSDYHIEVTIARSELASAKLALNEEEARAEQALRDWKKINSDKQAPALVQRTPQLASANARLEAAQARLDKAQLALQRTKVRAPYDGYIIEKRADIGQLINSNTPVATIFASDSLEVRLPVPGNKIQFLSSFALDNKQPHVNKASALLTADFGSLKKDWVAQIDRTESVIDSATRQWFIIAKLPAQLLEDEPLLKVGQFVSADIEGKYLENVFVIASKLLSQNNEIYLLQDERLKKIKVDVLWQSDDQAVIARQGPEYQLEEGQLLVTTLLNFVSDGTKARQKDASVMSKRADKADVTGDTL